MGIRASWVVFAIIFAGSAVVAAPVPVTRKLEVPTFTGQAQSVQTFIEFYAALARNSSPKAADAFEQYFKDVLGEAQFSALNVKKPIGIAGYLRPKIEQSTFFLAVPITTEAAALKLFEKVSINTELDKTVPGLYMVKFKKLFSDGTSVYLRFVDTVAYFGINVDAADMIQTNLQPYGNLIDDKETAALALRMMPTKLPQEVKNIPGGWIKDGLALTESMMGRPGPLLPKSWPPFAKTSLLWMERHLTALHESAELVTVRVRLESKTLANELEVEVVPKAKSELQTLIAQHKKTEGRFHQIASADTVFGVTAAITSLGPDYVATTGPFVHELFSSLTKSARSPALQLIVEHFNGKLHEALDAGQVDFGLAIQRGAKKEHHTVSGAIGVPKGADAAKVLRTALEALDKDQLANIKFDAETIGDVPVHMVRFKEQDMTIDGVFGKDLVLRYAYGKDACYVAVGEDGLAELKRAVVLKATAAPAHSTFMTPKNLVSFVAGLGGGVNEVMGLFFGSDDTMVQLWAIEVAPGETLKVRLKQHGFGLLFQFAMFFR